MTAGCPALKSPSDRARAALARISAEGIRIPLGRGRALQVPRGELQATAVDAWEQEGGTIEAFGQLSLEGRVGDVVVSYVGNERFRVACGGACEVQGGIAPRLAGVLAALLDRREALGKGDPAALAALATGDVPAPDEAAVRGAARREVAGWFIRVESDEAIVGEADPGGVQKRLLLSYEHGRWTFDAGLI